MLIPINRWREPLMQRVIPAGGADSAPLAHRLAGRLQELPPVRSQKGQRKQGVGRFCNGQRPLTHSLWEEFNQLLDALG